MEAGTHTDGCQSLTVLSLEPDAIVPFTPSKATEYTAACIQHIMELLLRPGCIECDWIILSYQFTACAMHVRQI